jgi:hypothetical protein
MDLVDEQRCQAAIKNARYRQALRRYHQWFMRSRELQVDDLVLKRVLSWEGMNKLSPCWEGPYWVALKCGVLDRSSELRLPADFPVLWWVVTGPHELATTPTVLRHFCNQKDAQARLSN